MATLLSCVGLLIQVIGYAWGWHGDESTAIGLWYVGFVGIVVPFTWLLLAPSRTGHQRLGAALAFGLIMYASWFLTDPIMSTRFDETLHVTTLVDMVDAALVLLSRTPCCRSRRTTRGWSSPLPGCTG